MGCKTRVVNSTMRGPQRQLKVTYRFRDFFRINLVVGISWFQTHYHGKIEIGL